MAARQIWLGLFIIPCGAVNTYLIDGGADGLILIDTGFPGKTDLIFDGVRNLGYRPSAIKHVILTHAHFDHIGGLAAIVDATNAQTWMHGADIEIAQNGNNFRTLKPASELLPKLLYKLNYRTDRTTKPALIDHRLADGDVIPLAGGLQVIGAPGHCAGQIALLWQGHRVLIAADSCIHLLHMLNSPLGWEDEAEGKRSLQKLCGYEYDLACFGHGPPLAGQASVKMSRHWIKDAEPPAPEHA